MKYDTVIGIEIHCELKTHTKMFSSAPLVYGAQANTAVNEVDIALPGTLPSVNAQAVAYGVRLSQALNLEIDSLVRFDRKNYYYSDLPKGYQITQQFHPLGQHGFFDIQVGEDIKRIGINRLHMEEDTAKQFHEGDKTLIDFNRAGTPLLEIVTEADFTTGEEAAAYVEGLRLLVVHMGISDGKMAEGSYRCDVNISLKPKGQKEFGTKVEIKNLNSISNVQKSIEFEIKRQSAALDNGETLVQETRRFDESKQETVAMRTKETLVDYRYFTEPNIPPIRLSDDFLKQPVTELPLRRQLRYVESFGLSNYDAGVLVQDRELSDYFEAICEKSQNPKLVVNWLTQDMLAHSDKREGRAYSDWISVDAMVSLISFIEAGDISNKQAKEVFEHVVLGKQPKDIIESLGMKQVSDIGQIEAWVNQVLEANPQAIEDYKNGQKKSVGFVVGQVMKLSKGQVNPRLASETVLRLLDMN